MQDVEDPDESMNDDFYPDESMHDVAFPPPARE